MAKKKRLNLTLDPDVIKAAKKKAIDVGTTVSEEVEKRLRQWIEGDPPPENEST